jgi:uncharacterized lipoprotein NlpE involved in copper resistance
MKKILYTLVIIVPFVFIGCDNYENNPKCKFSNQGAIVDYTGLDGCGVLVQTDSETFEVVNWEEMNFIPKDGMAICFEYDVKDEWVSICMIGTMISITDCQVLE